MKNFFQRFRRFFGETTTELKRADWPAPRELWRTTGVVLLAIALIGLCVVLYDFSVYNWVQLLTRVVSPAPTAP